MPTPICTKCAKSLESSFNFCPNCGYNLKNNSQSKIFLSVGIAALLVSGFLVQDKFLGTAPKAKLFESDVVSKKQVQIDSKIVDEISGLKSKIAANPDDITLKKLLSKKMWEAIQDIKDPESFTSEPVLQQLGLELVDLLSELTANDPKDSESALTMANISFTMRLFSKSIEFYEKYLKLNPDDFVSRSHYASSLTFLRRYKESVTELDKVLKTKPDFFQALAYKTITLAEMGNAEEAAKTGELAVKFAPNDEAKQRIQSFVSSLQKKNSTDNKNIAEKELLKTFFTNHQIIGPKLTRFETDKRIIKLFLKDFPMDAMPPVAKEVLFKKIVALKAGWKDFDSVVFVDTTTSQVLAEVTLK